MIIVIEHMWLHKQVIAIFVSGSGSRDFYSARCLICFKLKTIITSSCLENMVLL